jgi:hypothetical protein
MVYMLPPPHILVLRFQLTQDFDCKVRWKTEDGGVCGFEIYALLIAQFGQ